MVEAVEQRPRPVRGANLWPMTVEAYHVLGDAGVIPENTELLYGLVYTKMPKSPLHTFLLYFFIDALQAKQLAGFWVRSEQPLTCNESEPEPDISVVRGLRTDFRGSHPPTAELVIEICVSSHEYDRSKLRAYATAQVKECWLVLVPERQIEIFSAPVNGAYTQSTLIVGSETAQSQAIPEISIALSALFQKA